MNKTKNIDYHVYCAFIHYFIDFYSKSMFFMFFTVFINKNAFSPKKCIFIDKNSKNHVFAYFMHSYALSMLFSSN